MPRAAILTPAVFVSADTGARLCEVSRDTWDAWVASGFLPPPAINRGQTRRWHWPSIEARLAQFETEDDADPFVTGAGNVKTKKGQGHERRAAP